MKLRPDSKASFSFLCCFCRIRLDVLLYILSVITKMTVKTGDFMEDSRLYLVAPLSFKYLPF